MAKKAAAKKATKKVAVKKAEKPPAKPAPVKAAVKKAPKAGPVQVNDEAIKAVEPHIGKLEDAHGENPSLKAQNAIGALKLAVSYLGWDSKSKGKK